MAKATHSGTCQLCFARQKLPGGVLSQHGYTTRWGFFEGVCPGSKHLPYELSCDLIEDARERQIAKAAELRATAQNYRTLDYTGVSRAWMRVYFSAKFQGETSGYQWREVNIVEVEPITCRDGTVIKQFVYEYKVREETKRERCDLYSLEGERTLPNIIRHYNSRFADHLDQEAAQRDDYAAHLLKMLRAWKHAPEALVPVK